MSQQPIETLRQSYPPLGSAIVTLIMLCLAMVISLLDRHLLGLLIAPIRADLGISDTQIALLQGFAFVVFYLVAGLLFGVLIDRYSRRNIIAGSLAGWSVMTMLCGLAQNFWQLFAARSGVGVGEAGLHPAAFSKLCDMFAPPHRGRAFAVLGWAGNLGAAASMLGGAALYAWLSAREPLIEGVAVWKMTFIAAGIPGIILAVLFLFVREPARMEQLPCDRDQEPANAPGIKVFLRANWRLVLPLLGVFALVEFTAYAMLSFGAAYYMRVFGVPLYQAGLLMGFIVLIGGLGSLASGFISDHFARGTGAGGRLRTAMWAGVAAAPLLLVWSLAPDCWISFACGALGWGMFSISGTQGPLIMADLVPNTLRGRMGSVYVFFKTGTAAILGPLAVALFTEQVFKDDAMVNYSLACVTPAAMAISALLAWRSLRSYDRVRDDLHAQLAAAPDRPTEFVPVAPNASAPLSNT